MKRGSQSRRAAWRLVFWTFVLLLALLAAGVTAVFVSKLIVAVSGLFAPLGIALGAVWIVFALFTLYAFRDPDPIPPTIPNAVVAPAHGKVDLVDETIESEVMGGACQRISISLALWDVHVQKAPLAGRIVHLRHAPGRFRLARRAQAAAGNENVLLGLQPSDYPSQRVGVRLMAGWIARRIEVFVAAGQAVERGERIGLIRYGSRCELYLPREAKVRVKAGEKVKGGETIVASFD